MSKVLVGILDEAFEISNRGVVIIVELTNKVKLKTGHVIEIENIKTSIKSLEMLNYGSLTPPKDQTAVGLLVEGNKTDYLKLKGSSVFLVKNHDP